MKIGLIDADLTWRPHANGRRYGKSKADIYPNLALMKISAYHKLKGDTVNWYEGILEHYDRVYISKVFSDTITVREIINADEVYFGGSGFHISVKNGREIYHPFPDADRLAPKNWQPKVNLPEGAEHIMPDYSLYPTIHNTAYGFLSRGCPRMCDFCHVKSIDGGISRKVADLHEWWNGQKNIVLMDPNILACKDWNDLLTQLADSKAKVDINQGLDARLLTPAKMELLNQVKLSTIHFAWDDYRQKDSVLKGLRMFADGYKHKLDRSHAAQVFVLCNFDTTFEQDLERVYTLRDMGFEPYIMVYDKQNAAPKYKSLQRWVNMRAIFHSVNTFEEYDKLKAKE